LLNVLNDNAYIENMQKTKDLREGPWNHHPK
jgi:hypothetical protein